MKCRIKKCRTSKNQNSDCHRACSSEHSSEQSSIRAKLYKVSQNSNARASGDDSNKVGACIATNAATKTARCSDRSEQASSGSSSSNRASKAEASEAEIREASKAEASESKQEPSEVASSEGREENVMSANGETELKKRPNWEKAAINKPKTRRLTGKTSRAEAEGSAMSARKAEDSRLVTTDPGSHYPGETSLNTNGGKTSGAIMGGRDPVQVQAVNPGSSNYEAEATQNAEHANRRRLSIKTKTAMGAARTVEQVKKMSAAR